MVATPARHTRVIRTRIPVIAGLVARRVGTPIFGIAFVQGAFNVILAHDGGMHAAGRGVAAVVRAGVGVITRAVVGPECAGPIVACIAAVGRASDPVDAFVSSLTSCIRT